MGLLKPYAGYSNGDGRRLTQNTTFIIVHNIEHVRRAFRVAASLNSHILLLSPPDAAGTLGPAVFKNMIDISTQETGIDPSNIRAYIDCGSDAGHALKAIQEGCGHIRIDTSSEVLAKLRSIAGPDSSIIEATPISTLDLNDTSISDEAIETCLLS